MSNYLEQIREKKNIRQSLIELKQLIHDENQKKALAYELAGDFSDFVELLSDEDPKIRKNAVLILGEMECDDLVDTIWNAYEEEHTLFVKADYIKSLSIASDINIKDINSLIEALYKRIDYFISLGCVSSDHALEYCPFALDSEENIDKIFKKSLLGNKLTVEEIEKYKTYILIKLAKKYKEKNISMQIHLEAMRNNNKKMFNLIGADTGFDSIADYNIIRNLSYLLDECSKTFGLPKMIFYSLNIKDYYPLSTLIGCFQGDRIKGKMQLGSAWWFCDNKDGMEEQMKILANTGSLPLFIGMLTDSRSFLSYPRHEYFRRILCNILGNWAEKGEVPNDIEFLGNVVKNICFNNAKEYFS